MACRSARSSAMSPAGQCQQGGSNRSGPAAGLRPGGRQRGGRVGAARLGAEERRPAMNGPELLEHAAGIVNRRRREYGEPIDFSTRSRALVADAPQQGQPGAGGAVPDLPEARPARPRPEAPRQPSRRRRLRRGPAGGQPMIGPAGYRSCLAARSSDHLNDEDLLAMRRGACASRA